MGGRKGKEKQQEESLALRGFPHRAPHTTQFLLSESLSWALSRAQEVAKSILALNHNPAVSAPGSQEQVAATVQVPRERQGALTASSGVSFGSLALSYYWYYFNSFLLGFPAFSCKTSSEMPLLELITLSWQREFSKFNSPPLLPSMNSPFPVAISCHKHVSHKKQNVEKIRPRSPQGKLWSPATSAHNVPAAYLELPLFSLFPPNIPIASKPARRLGARPGGRPSACLPLSSCREKQVPSCLCKPRTSCVLVLVLAQENSIYTDSGGRGCVGASQMSCTGGFCRPEELQLPKESPPRKFAKSIV